jgi:hypothetical protein
MNINKISEIPLIPWPKIEKILFSIGKGYRTDSPRKSDIDKALIFLESILFIDGDRQLTESGKKYYSHIFILNDQNSGYAFLSEKLKELKSVQLVCQVLWGREGLTKENIINLFYMEGVVNPTDKINLGPFISLLNKCKILSYDKKNGFIKILYNPINEGEIKSSFLTPDTPYTNIKLLRNHLGNCHSFIWWWDKHFSSKGFEPLSDVVDGNQLNEIKILLGKTSNVNKRMKNDFVRFKKEMEIRGIKTECRVIVDNNLYHDIHDRWIISKDIVLNLPPINSIYKGQYSEIKKTEQNPPFSDWWERGKDIIEDWGIISK